MKKHFIFNTNNDMKSIDNMSKFFNNIPIVFIADANLLGILIIACAYHNIRQVDLITDCLQLLGYSIIRSVDTDGVYISLINDNANMCIVNNHVEVW